MIPKKIHYCWFGEKEPGELEQKCIESWKKILPDYELRFWGNDCLDRFDNKYLRQAVEAKKWAFVSDYVRLYALLEEGGLYFDTDEEVVRRLDDGTRLFYRFPTVRNGQGDFSGINRRGAAQ